MTSAAQKESFLELFIQVTRSITSCLDPDEVFNLITRSLTEALDVDAATLRLLDASGKKLVLMASHGLSDTYLNRGPIDTEEPVFEALEGRPIVVANAAEDSRVAYHDATVSEGIQTIAVIPIPFGGKIKGILRLLSRDSRSFSPGELDVVMALAEQCGIAIENARIVNEQKKQIKHFHMLQEITRRINAASDLNAILDLVVTRMPDIMGLKAATIRFFEGGGKLSLKASHGLSRRYLERGPLDEEAATYYIKEGEPIVILDATSDIHTIYHEAAKEEGIGSILAVPVTAGEEIIGILRLISSEIRAFSSLDINFALSVADQSGIAIQRAIDQQK